MISNRTAIRTKGALATAGRMGMRLAVCLAVAFFYFVQARAFASSGVEAMPRSSASSTVEAMPRTGVVVDHVVAVVNNSVILYSDMDRELHFGVLDPNQVGKYQPSPARALERLISRTLIEQQIVDQMKSAPTADEKVDADRELAARVLELRKVLPACERRSCQTDAGWKAFLAEQGLSIDDVESYLRKQINVLAFIEQRFRQGIRIAPAEIETFYRETLLPQYKDRNKAPSLESVAPRIQEVLLEQQVNVLLDDWLASLRKEGEIEVLDPAFESIPSTIPGASAAPPLPLPPPPLPSVSEPKSQLEFQPVLRLTEPNSASQSSASEPSGTGRKS